MPEPLRQNAATSVGAAEPAAGTAEPSAGVSEYRVFTGPWQRFRRNRPAVVALVMLLLICLTCFSTLGWSASGMRAQQLNAARQPPSLAHALGTDELGRSLLWRTLYGGAISLSLGLLAAGVSIVIGTVYGLVAGYVGGRWDELMMRAVDVLYTLPYMLLVMLFAVSIGAWLENWRVVGGEWSRFFVLALAIGGVSWLTMARVVRGQVLSLREQPFVEAARALGLPTSRILLRHLLPNLAGPILVFAALTVPQAILQESFLSFLGVGVQPPQATWGSLAADGVHLLNPVQFDWWLVVVPCLALSVTLLALNFVGDGLRDAIDVRRSN
jgi:oligopeptide transport system permease protein